jgi:hypothetical protein
MRDRWDSSIAAGGSTHESQRRAKRCRAETALRSVRFNQKEYESNMALQMTIALTGSW